MSDINFPTNSDKLAVIGRNGSGKTVAAAWHLSLRDFDRMPWLIIDSKGDEFVKKLVKLVPEVKRIDLTETPKKPGIYVVKPLPQLHDEAVEAMLFRIHQRGKIGIWYDETYTIPQSSAFITLLTQGRSLKIPQIILTQRPVDVSRFVWTESNFFQIFDLSHSDDIKTIKKFVPAYRGEALPPYHSLWYDQKAKRSAVFGPVPDEAETLNRIADKLRPRRTYI